MKPIIPFAAAQKHCPVCGKVSYSLSGEHPQCSVVRDDPALAAKRRKQQARNQLLAIHTPLPPGQQ